MPLIRMNALSLHQWEAVLINIPQVAGMWDIDWSDDKSDCGS